MSLNTLPIGGVDDKTLLLLLVETVNKILTGRANNAGSVTLTASATSTTVNDNQFQSSMVPVLIPTTANAAAALSTTYLSTRSNGQFTLTHANNAQVDRTFLYIRQG